MYFPYTHWHILFEMLQFVTFFTRNKSFSLYVCHTYTYFKKSYHILFEILNKLHLIIYFVINKILIYLFCFPIYFALIFISAKTCNSHWEVIIPTLLTVYPSAPLKKQYVISLFELHNS